MDKAVIVAGIVAVIAIVGIVLFVSHSISGQAVYYPNNNIYAQDFYVWPSGVQMKTDSGVVLLQTDNVINNVCSSTLACNGTSTYVCCKHDASSCFVPDKDYQSYGNCPNAYRSKCLCREDYVAGLVEKYG